MKFLKWWPLLLGPAAIALVYLMNALGLVDVVGRTTNELLAMPLIGAASVLFAIAAYRQRSEFHLILAVITFGFFCREWHFAGTHKGIYILIACCGVWGLIRIRHLFPVFLQGNGKYWLVGAGCVYALSILVSRRLFAAHHLGILPMEGQLHIHLEETLENTAHLLMLASSMVVFPLRKNIQASVDPEQQPDTKAKSAQPSALNLQP